LADDDDDGGGGGDGLVIFTCRVDHDDSGFSSEEFDWLN
jgi:hypothetical protein